MLGSPQLNWKQLAGLSRRVAISTRAGIDVRSTWKREVDNSRWPARNAMIPVRDAVLAGDTMGEGMRRAGRSFPPLYCEMVAIGERTGHTAEVFRRLADHYDHRVKMRRAFLQSLIWPMFQLGAAILIVGLMIWIMGILATKNGNEPIDILGFGLVGTPGLIKYSTFVGCVFAVLFALIVAAKRGVFWIKPLKTTLLFIPAVGGCFRTLALARMAWSLHLTLNTEMDLRQVLPLALRSTGFEFYQRHTTQVVEDIVAGNEIHEALGRTRAFPMEFLTVIEVGETTGELVESMGRLTEQYEEQAQAAMHILSRIAGFLIWAGVACLIIFIIFRIMSFYLGMINGALDQI
jgi:type IV pilus assembly protein PilC